MSATIHDRISSVEAELIRTLISDQALRLRPKRVEIEEITDLLEHRAWRIRLVLPTPEGPTWDRDAVLALRRAAERAFDMKVQGTDSELDGLTLATITMDEADDVDRAVEPEPAAGEDPARLHR